MSVKTLPLLIVNLGGEMLYILDQRLRENKLQKGWSEDDRKRVLKDIVRMMFSKAFMDELMEPQDLYSHRAVRCVLTRLAHTSIMRLDSASMDRLYDLMTMAFKYQIFQCPRPRDLLLISLNHIDGVRDLVKDNPCLVHQIDEAQRVIIEMYTPLSDGEFQLIRQTLLAFFQDLHIRVSLFLTTKVQNPNGRFVLPTSGPVPLGTSVPALIRYFNSRGREIRRGEFTSGGFYTSSVMKASFDMTGVRATHLGTNMYNVFLPEDTRTSETTKNALKSKQVSEDPNPLAKEELNLLAKLMGGMEMWNCDSDDVGFKMNLFPTDLEQQEDGISAAAAAAADGSFSVISIQAAKDREVDTELTRIAAEFTSQEEAERPSDKGNDLLAMMDEL
ncbi:protein OSCP1a [Trichomycterus rosablanca]|uniref:protein OSCP1a n=1 Tax=Trichomycterus rosablanca TaxID=2290929 RepID=UPI002F35CDEB